MNNFEDILRENPCIMSSVMLGEAMVKIKERKELTNYQKNADEYIFLCPKCDSVWEVLLGWKGKQRTKVLHYYYDFPKYGRIEKKCEICVYI